MQDEYLARIVQMGQSFRELFSTDMDKFYYYTEIEEYARSLLQKNATLVMTGHSLGKYRNTF